MNATGNRRTVPDIMTSSGSGYTVGTPRHPSIIDPILSKRVCFYKSGDPQFNGLRMVINNRTFKTFDALLDSLSKKVPLPFGVRNITTPRGVHAIYTLDELEDGKSYICSDSRKVKPINLALARKKLLPWYHARPVSSRRRTVQQARFFPSHKKESLLVRTPKRLVVFRNGNPTVKHTVVLHKRTTPTFESILEYISELIQFHVVKLHTPDGRRRYIVNRIHHSIAESSCDLPSNHTNSVEYESGRMLESVAEMEGDADEVRGRDDLLPTEDDIEKSFRVNQDGSMTVEMKVRLTIKEEETIHWTTTLTRSSVANQLNATCLPEPEAEQEISSVKSMDLRSSAASTDTIKKDKTEDNNDEDPPSLGNGVFSESSNEEDSIKAQMDVVSPRRAHTPGHKQIRQKQASMESIKSVTTEGIQKVMTLKEGITNLNMEELNASNVSCAEALKMIDSLREIASIEDSHKLKLSLSNLQQSASKQLLQSWKGFQELSDKFKSRSSTPNDSEQELVTEVSLEKGCSTDENVIDEIMDNLDIPEELKEELASFPVGVKSDSSDKENISAGIFAEPLQDNSDPKISPISEEDAFNVRDVTQDEKVNVDVCSIIKKFTEQSRTCNTVQAAKDKESQYGQNGASKCPPAQPNDKQTPEERHIYSTAVFVKEDTEGVQACADEVNQENQRENKQEKGHSEDEANQEKANMNGVVSCEKNLEKDSCSSEGEEQDMEGNQLQMHSGSEESASIPEDEVTHDDESGSELEGQHTSSANKVLGEQVCGEQSLSSSEAGEQHTSEEEPIVECEEIQQESRESDDLSNPEIHSEEEEDKHPSSNYYPELSEKEGRERISNPERQNMSFSDEEQPEEECTELSKDDVLSNPASPSNSEKEPQSQAGCMGLNVSIDESACNSDEPSSEEEQHETGCKELKVIIEESLSDNEQETMEENKHLDFSDKTKKHKQLKALIEETEEDKVSSEDEDQHVDRTLICNKKKSQNSEAGDLIENHDSYIKKEDEDSGNDHSSCEEHVEVEQPMVMHEGISSSIEEELSYYEKESNSEEEPPNMDRYTEESFIEYQEESSLATQSDLPKSENALEKAVKKEIISQSVAERVSLLEKQVAEVQRRNSKTESPPMRRCSQINAPLESDAEDSASELPTSQLALSTRSAPQSSLSFSYDSSGVITTEPEGSRVRSIREMFLAKSATDIQHGHRRFPSPNVPELSQLRAETSASGGYQSQSSSELSSGEDDSARKSITKGFVRRTIERLYGKKEANPDEEANERPPSAPKQKKKEHSSIFSPFHIARSKAVSELSYFNSANALDTLSEATRCVAFNAQVGPGDSVPIDNGRWLLRENTLIRKSVSDPVGINKTIANSPQSEGMCKDTEESNQHSIFSIKSEQEDKKRSFSRKCTYFSLPHASDSDACQDDLSTVSKSSANDSIVDTKDNSEDTKMWAERNSTLPGVGVTDFKMKDNKVHPLIQPPADGEVVVVQPG
ncbi:hypothetical protein L3Q82_018204, partial [Scortum barcoo]